MGRCSQAMQGQGQWQGPRSCPDVIVAQVEVRGWRKVGKLAWLRFSQQRATGILWARHVVLYTC
jgi:hypothetical protein